MKNLLPIGSVVRLEDGEKYLMIIGILQEDDEGDQYDYIACLFPEGYLDADTFFLFNHNAIVEVEFLGCVNAEVQLYMEELHQAGALDDDSEGMKNNDE